jgi:hypothetical protein
MSLAKRLERCARRSVGHNGWGIRHFLTLSLPRQAYPVPRPVMPADLTDRLGTPDEFGGFNRFHGDGTVTHVAFGEVHSGRDPREDRRPDDPTPLFVERDGDDPVWFTWTEARVWTGTASEESLSMPTDAVAHDAESPEWAWVIDVANVRAAQHRWDDTARRLAWCSEDVACLFGECKFCAKTTYHADDARTYGVTFAVESMYVRRFAIAAARLSRALRSEGVDARWRGL